MLAIAKRGELACTYQDLGGEQVVHTSLLKSGLVASQPPNRPTGCLLNQGGGWLCACPNHLPFDVAKYTLPGTHTHTRAASEANRSELLGSLFMFTADKVSTHRLEVHIPLRTDKRQLLGCCEALREEVAVLGSADGVIGPGTEAVGLISPPCQEMLQCLGGPADSFGLRWF